MVELGFDIISVKQMTTTRRSPSDDPEKSNLPLLLITLLRIEKSQAFATFLSRWRYTKTRVSWHSAITARSSAMYGLIVINLLAACGVVAATCTKNGQRKQTMCPHQHAGGRWETPSIKLSRLHPYQGRDRQKKGAKNTKEHNGKGVLFQLHHARSVLCSGSVK